MMSLSHTAGYAIHALGCLSDSGGQPRLIREVAESTGIPKPYLAKIVNQLTREGLVAAKRGYRGGIVLTRPANGISLLQVVEAVEGEAWIGECMLGITECAGRNICPTRGAWKGIRKLIEAALRGTTLADVLRPVRARAAAFRVPAQPVIKAPPVAQRETTKSRAASANSSGRCCGPSVGRAMPRGPRPQP